MKLTLPIVLLTGLLALAGSPALAQTTQAQPLDDNMFSVMSKSGGQGIVRQQPVDTSRPPCHDGSSSASDDYYYPDYSSTYGGPDDQGYDPCQWMKPAQKRAFRREKALEKERQARAQAPFIRHHGQVQQTGLSEGR